MLSLSGVTFRFAGGQQFVLSIPSLEASEGAIVVVSGDNGSGKSSAALVCTGVVPHFVPGEWHGTVTWRGRTLDLPGVREFAAFVQQDPWWYFRAFNGMDELATGDEALTRLDSVRLLVANVPLYTPLNRLSVGQRQRVAIASAVSQRTRIVVLDEPFAPLDSQGSAAAVEAIRAASAAGKLVILTLLPGEERVLTERGLSPIVFYAKGGELLETGEFRRPCARAVRGAGSLQSEPALALEDVWYSHRGANSPVLAGVSFLARRGCCVGISGENGAGKSTLARIVAGLVEPQHGVIAIRGRAQRGRVLRQVVQLAGSEPDTQLFLQTVKDEVKATLQCSGWSASETGARAEALLGLIRLNPRTDPFTLSHGRKRLLVTASVLSTAAEVAVLDEPFASLDADGVSMVLSFIEQWISSGRSVIALSHDRGFLRDVCKDTFRLRAGRMEQE